jgi:hypothetical protein
MANEIAIRLAVGGGSEAKAEFAAFRRSGEEAFQAVGATAETQSQRVKNQFDRAVDDAEAAQARLAAAAAKIAAITPKTAIQMQIEAANGSTARGGVLEQPGAARAMAQYEGSARASAAAFADLLGQQERAEATALKLKAAIDPLWVAEQRYARALEEVALAERAGILTAKDLADARGRAEQALRDARLAGSAADAHVNAYHRDLDTARSRAALLKAELDPLGAAQDRLNHKLEDYQRLQRLELLTTEQLTAAQARARREYDETRAAIARQTGTSHALSTMQRQTLIYTASDIVASGASGASPLQIAMQQGPQVLQAFAVEEGGLARIKALLFGSDGVVAGIDAMGEAGVRSGGTVEQAAQQTGGALDGVKDKAKEAGGALVAENGVGGATAKVTGLLTPMRLALGATAIAAIVATKAWYDYASAQAKLETLAVGLGAVTGQTVRQLEESAEAGAAAGRVSVAAAREMEAGFVAVGVAGGETMAKAIGISKDLGAALGTDAAGGAKALTDALADPAKGADDLRLKLGAIDAVTTQHIQTLLEENRVQDAQRVLIDAVGVATAGASDHVMGLSRAWDAVERAASGALDHMGRAIDLAVSGPADAQRLNDLRAEQQYRRNPKIGDLGGAFRSAAYVGMSDTDIQREADNLVGKIAAATGRAAQAATNKRVGQASPLISAYTGDDALSALKQNRAKLAAVLNDPAAVRDLAKAGGLDDARETLAAYTHAVETYLTPAARKAALDRADLVVARARTPQEKAAAAAARERLQQAGQVITAANAEAAAHARSGAALAQASRAGAGRAATQAREAEAMRVGAQAALDVGDAYLKSSAAGMTAEIRRKALTDATRKGIDVDAQVARELALRVGEGAAAGARSVATLREETTVRAAVNNAVLNGTALAAQMNDMLSDEAALRPLIALQAVVQGDALARLTTIVAAYRKAQADANGEQQRSAAILATHATDDAILGMRDQIEFARDRTGAGAVEIARRAAEREAADRYAALPEEDPVRAGYVANKVAEARTKQAADQAGYMAGIRNAQADTAALAARELQLVGLSGEKREAILDRLKLEIDLRSRGVDLAGSEAIEILNGVDAQARMNAALKLASATMDELRGFGERFVDTVLSEDTWSSWGNAGKTILAELKSEFLKLALLNPIKNLLNGGSALPTLGKLASLFGGGGPALAPNVTEGVSSSILAAASIAPIGFNAAGTERWSGGLTWVNENGPEIADLPNGTRIYPAAKSRQMLAAANDPPRTLRVEVVKGDLFDVHVTEIATPIAAGYAQQAMIGGSAMAREASARAARRRIG